MAVGGTNWNMWLRMSRVQLRQIAKSLDRTLIGLSHGKFPLQYNHNIFATWWKSLFDVSVAFRRASGFATSPLTRRGTAGIDRFKPAANVSRFATLSRVPSGAPRGLFTNWNMTTSTRLLGQRAYSTSSIKFTQEAVNNMTISLRCFFDSLDGLDKCSHSKPFQHACNFKPEKNDEQPVAFKTLSQKDINFIRDLELFKVMKAQNQMVNESSPYFVEKSGSYIEFTVPEFNVNATASVPLSFLNPSLLGNLNEMITSYNNDLKSIYGSVDMILQNYGSLPITFHRNKIRIHFPNSVVTETEKLIAGLNITTGIIYADTSRDITFENTRLSALVNDDKSTSTWSLVDESSLANKSAFSPVLSEASDDTYELI
ncbi:spg5p [Saccharomyces arboricola H-6]|uniref:Spg5p n=1 Tax=Saccharomyces arboricola (strain H-6 / AS 2.3317 / CBS 10644) TaxID=1160507 RepID=J8LPZ7_SACAR|nr:spg5p [Saccharomyces arboricola H-6]